MVPIEVLQRHPEYAKWSTFFSCWFFVTHAAGPWSGSSTPSRMPSAHTDWGKNSNPIFESWRYFVVYFTLWISNSLWTWRWKWSKQKNRETLWDFYNEFWLPFGQLLVDIEVKNIAFKIFSLWLMPYLWLKRGKDLLSMWITWKKSKWEPLKTTKNISSTSWNAYFSLFLFLSDRYRQLTCSVWDFCDRRLIIMLIVHSWIQTAKPRFFLALSLNWSLNRLNEF